MKFAVPCHRLQYRIPYWKALAGLSNCRDTKKARPQPPDPLSDQIDRDVNLINITAIYR